MRKLITPAHPWFHPDFPIQHSYYGGSHHIMVYAGPADMWGTPAVRIDHKMEDGKHRISITHSNGQPDTLEKAQAFHRAYGHALKIAKDITNPKHAVSRMTAARMDAPLDLHQQLMHHPDHLTALAAHRNVWLKTGDPSKEPGRELGVDY